MCQGVNNSKIVFYLEMCYGWNMELGNTFLSIGKIRVLILSFSDDKTVNNFSHPRAFNSLTREI